MVSIDFVIIGIIAVVIGAACFYIYKAKKNGKKCIGCPYQCSCNSKSDCSACNCGRSEDKK